jgi:beta-barrel assembly-enhancing protease
VLATLRRRPWVTVFVSVLLSACATGPTVPAKSTNAAAPQLVPAIDVYRYALARAFKQVAADELDEAYAALSGIIYSPIFDQLESNERHVALLVAGLVALDLDKAAEGHPLLIRSSAMPEAGAEDWAGLLTAARLLSKPEDAVQALTQLGLRWPEKVHELDADFVWWVVRQARPASASEPVRYGLLNSLYVAKWQPSDGIEPSGLWRDLAELEIERKQLARAQEIMGRVQAPSVIVSMRIDKRFDPLREAVPQAFDVDAALANDLVLRRAIVQRSPRSLDALIDLTYSLLDACLYDELLQMTTEVMRKVESAPAKEPPYDDMHRLIWIQDNRSRALAATQRWSEAETEVRNAANSKENGGRNVSHIINLAWFYAEAGRNDEALAVLLDLGDMSPYGHMQMHGARYTAALQKGDEQIAGESLAYLDKHRDDALDTWQWTLVRANRLDDAAALLIERLQDPARRNQALRDVQDYNDPKPQSQRALWNERWAQIKNRPDVRRAIDAVGRVERFRISQGRD